MLLFQEAPAASLLQEVPIAHSWTCSKSPAYLESLYDQFPRTQSSARFSYWKFKEERDYLISLGQKYLVEKKKKKNTTQPTKPKSLFSLCYDTLYLHLKNECQNSKKHCLDFWMVSFPLESHNTTHTAFAMKIVLIVLLSPSLFQGKNNLNASSEQIYIQNGYCFNYCLSMKFLRASLLGDICSLPAEQLPER